VGVRRGLSVAIVTVCLVVPLVEAFDTWDHTLQDGNDTEATIVIATLCVGIALSVATSAIVARLRSLSSNARVQLRLLQHARSFARLPIFPASNDSSPPVALRI